jgi:hypothetical protein
MNIFVPHFTLNRDLSATSQAARELGDSQNFLDNRDASRLSRIGKAELAKLNERGQA